MQDEESAFQIIVTQKRREEMKEKILQRRKSERKQ